MLLPIHLPSCANDLHLATALAEHILEYAVQAHAGFDEDRFRSTLAEGPWLLGRSETFRQVLRAIFDLGADERVILRDAFVCDIGFAGRLDDLEFTFLFRWLPRRVREVGGRFLVAFYDELLAGGGFSDLPGQELPKLDRRAVEKCYREANPLSEQVCLACLEHLPRPAKGRSLVDREHFFPKSIYPPLSVHPNNLTLTCIACNQRVHIDADPLSVFGQGELQGTFLPYDRPGIHEVRVEFRLSDPYLPVKLIGNGRSPFGDERARNIDRVYAISERWSASLRYIHYAIIEELRLRCRDLNPREIERELTEQIKKAERTRFRVPGSYLQGEYARWLLAERIDTVLEECTTG